MKSNYKLPGVLAVGCVFDLNADRLARFFKPWGQEEQLAFDFPFTFFGCAVITPFTDQRTYFTVLLIKQFKVSFNHNDKVVVS